MAGDDGQAERPLSLDVVVDTLRRTGRPETPGLVEGWLDRLDANERFALLKLITGGLRIGVSARLAKTALAQLGGQPLDDIEQLWHGLSPPYTALFAWLTGNGPRPAAAARAAFRPVMLAHPLDDEDIARLDPAAYRAEWKWDGIRVQLAAEDGQRRLYSRTGDDISGAFPDVLAAMNFEAVLDGELLLVKADSLPAALVPDPATATAETAPQPVVAPFADLQKRLNRKTVSTRLAAAHPAWVRLYDLLFVDGEDLRPLSFVERRARLEAWIAAVRPARMDLSPLVPFAGWDDLAGLRDGARAAGIEGLMLKRADSPYLAGRPKGPWFKWKRAPLTLDTVLMYAQRGHGKRSSYYSDYTFGVWSADADGVEVLVPVGKAYSGFTDEELISLDRWVRANTTNRFGPVREVAVGLVLEVAFDSAQRSSRHKSGLAMRFPRIHRIRWDKPPADADRLDTLAAMVVG